MAIGGATPKGTDSGALATTGCGELATALGDSGIANDAPHFGHFALRPAALSGALQVLAHVEHTTAIDIESPESGRRLTRNLTELFLPISTARSLKSSMPFETPFQLSSYESESSAHHLDIVRIPVYKSTELCQKTHRLRKFRHCGRRSGVATILGGRLRSGVKPRVCETHFGSSHGGLTSPLGQKTPRIVAIPRRSGDSSGSGIDTRVGRLESANSF